MLNKKTYIILYFLFLCAATLLAQNENDAKVDYMRSSLYLDLIYLDKDFSHIIPDILNDIPFPDKYNNHNNSKTEGTNFLQLMQNYSQLNVEPDLDKLFQNYIDESNLENKLIETWFSRKRDGTFDMSVVAQRGFYNASQLESDLAENTTRGRASIADAGENLIKNTFVVLGLMYVNGNHKKFVIGSQVRLYKLDWNNEKAIKFYNNYWIPRGKFDFKKRKAFKELDLFNLEFIGAQSHTNIIKVTRQEPILELPDRRHFSARLPRRIEDKDRFFEIVTRHFDEVYANLQKEFEIFRVVSPLISTEPLTAQIGMKEGLKGGEKFEVLEKIYNEETGTTKYKRKGIIKVVAGKIWDNRYNVGEKGTQKKEGATQFSGKGNFYPGMLIRQID
ncbi:hypothetical protein [Algibacter sp. PT7-4]|uniref:hypothetical protein n=1 Tax=Algibacter ulvanivorans TaxID=3400999 RepID=UPI003AB0F0F7